MSELTDEAGVSVRTVRYYVAEGLLPPPVTAGPRSFYTRAHLDRLRLIDRMKTSYLPLKEIRRRLTALDDEEIRRLVEVEAPPLPSAATPSLLQEASSRPPDSAASYIARLLHRAPPAAPAAPLRAALGESDQVMARAVAPEEQGAGAVEDFVLESLALPPSTTEAEEEATSWRRIALSDDAELLIREESYQRKRERVDWLVGWARKVFG